MSNSKQDNNLDKSQQTRGRTTLLLLFIFFLVPVIVVIMMIKFNWKPNGDSFGHLLKPPVALTAPTAQQELWIDKWQVVYIAEQCEEGCHVKLQALRKLHASMYKDIIRVQRVLITKTKDLSKVRADFPDMIILDQNTENVDAVVESFAVGQERPYSAGNLYFVDPLGFLIMRYPPEIPLADIRNDLKKLLKFAWAG